MEHTEKINHHRGAENTKVNSRFLIVLVLDTNLDKAAKRLPQEHGQPGDVLKVRVGSCQRQIGWQRSRCRFAGWEVPAWASCAERRP